MSVKKVECSLIGVIGADGLTLFLLDNFGKVMHINTLTGKAAISYLEDESLAQLLINNSDRIPIYAGEKLEIVLGRK